MPCGRPRGISRVDGALRPVEGAALTEPEVDRLVTGVLGAELTERFRREKQVDFAFSWGEKARLRGNAFVQRGASALALRIIPFSVPSSEQLGLPPVVIGWAGMPRGFVLVTGPTGSGKSTSLAALLDHVNTHRPVHILTIEDPIEYLHQHKRSAVNQREVGTDTDSFPAALRSALREDPDVLLLGEMRDPESISAALTIAETGHLVFATLHTNDTSQTLDRIVDVFPAEQQPQIRLQLAHTLVGILNLARSALAAARDLDRTSAEIADEREVITALFESRRRLGWAGSNLNQAVKSLNSGAEAPQLEAAVAAVRRAADTAHDAAARLIERRSS
ncbi:type IV pilus twitching motility protein PilT [Streptomyces seoulensis]